MTGFVDSGCGFLNPGPAVVWLWLRASQAAVRQAGEGSLPLHQLRPDKGDLQMKSVKSFLAILVVTAAVAAVPAASAAPIVHLVASGDTSDYQGFGVAVVNDVAPGTAGFTGGGSIHHFTIKGNCSDGLGGICAALKDGRNPVIPVESGSYWVVWVCPSGGCNGTNATDAWAYDSVDATTAIREYLAQPTATSVVAPGTSSGVAADKGQDQISSALFLYGANETTVSANCPATATTCDDAFIPADVYAAVSGATFISAFTGIRPEDALFATERSNSALTGSPWTGLGYGGGPTTLVGASIQSAFSSSFATPILFGLPGTTDPFSGDPVPSTITIFSVGEIPIVFFANRTNANGLGYKTGVVPYYGNLVDNAATPLVANPLGKLFGGNDCAGDSLAFGLGGVLPGGVSNFPISLVLREPTSGAMNVTEYSAFDTYGGTSNVGSGSSVGNSPSFFPSTSQEANVNTVNPLNNLPCTPGSGGATGGRYRALSSSEEVGKPGSTATGVAKLTDSLGYAFFSFGNFSNLKTNPNFGYLTLDGVDPIFNNYAGGDPGQPATTAGVEQGELPGCTPGTGACATTGVWTGGNSFPHLRDGTYRAWTVERAICDTTNAHCLSSSDKFGAEAIVAAAQDDIHNATLHSVADYLPFSVDGSFGTGFGDVSYVRSHYAFNSAIGKTPSEYPASHTAPGFSISATFPTLGAVADLANGISDVAGDPEVGGDAGGCIVAATQSGSVLAISQFKFPAPNAQHIRAQYTVVSGPQPSGFCDGGPRANQVCYSTNTGGSAPPPGECGTGFVCIPDHQPVPLPTDGESLTVTGEANNKNNGVWVVTKIVDSAGDGNGVGNLIKLHVPAGSTPVNVAADNSKATVSSGCSQ
jgi:hypothetical protein